MKIVKVRLLKSLGPKLPEGTEVDVETDDKGIPLQQFWRKRFRDLKAGDKAFEIVKKTAKGDSS